MLCIHHQQQHLQNCSAVNRHYTRLISLSAIIGDSKTHRVARHRCEAIPASAAAAGIVLAFLPWSGCSQGGFYATGVEGTHGKDCQAIYQPAAAAEARFAARLQQQQQQQQQQGQAAFQQLTAATVSQAPNPATSSSRSSNTISAPGSRANGSEQQQQQLSQQQQQQLTAAEQLQQVPDAAKDLVRDIMHEDNRLRTKQLVDDAWQSLE